VETYKIVRHYFNTATKRVIERGLTLEQAQAHCKNPETSSHTACGYQAKRRTKIYGPWFDGYTLERN